MSLSLISTVADFVTSIAMIASLLFVALQVKRNTQEVKNSHYQATQARMSTFQSRTMDERVATVVQKGKKSYTQLGESEKLVFTSWLIEYHIVISNLLDFGRQGIFGAELVDMARARFEKLLHNPGVHEYYQDTDREALPAWANEYASRVYGDS